jgi:hypothetical protein
MSDSSAGQACHWKPSLPLWTERPQNPRFFDSLAE